MRRPLRALVPSLRLISFFLPVDMAHRRIVNFGVATHAYLDSSGAVPDDKVGGHTLRPYHKNGGEVLDCSVYFFCRVLAVKE
jgi:hypothetical protein